MVGSRASTRWGGFGLAVLALGCGGPGQPPRVAELPPQVAVVGQELLLRVQASDPDGDALEYDFSSITLPTLDAEAELLVTPDGQALFTWIPVAADLGDHVIDFVVSDGTHEVRRPVSVEVRGAAGDGSVPVFIKPVGEGIVHDLADGPCVTPVAIEVADPDDAEIELRQEPPLIAGAELSTSPDGLQGLWEWCPSPEQRAQAGIHELVLAADDGDNPPTLKAFSVWLQRAGEDCPTAAPTVEHASVGQVETLFDPEIVVTAGDDVGLLAAPIVFWSTEVVPQEEMNTVFMARVGGDAQQGTYVATLPNPAVPLGAGGIASLHYRISAGDEDSCFTASPPEGLHELVVTNPGGPGGAACEPCSYDAQCGDADDLCLQFGVDDRACGEACEDSSDCDGAYACSPQPVVSVEGVSARQCVPQGGLCSAIACEDDDSEPNDTLQQALDGPALPEDVLAGRTLCPLDEDWYRVEIEQRAQVIALLSNASVVPNLDLSLTDAAGVLQSTEQTASSEELLDTGCLEPGTYALRVHTRDEGEGSYDLAYVLDTNPC